MNASLHVHLTVDDARTAQLAGCKFARTLAGADSEDFALVLIEQEHEGNMCFDAMRRA